MISVINRRDYGIFIFVHDVDTNTKQPLVGGIMGLGHLSCNHHGGMD